MACRVRHRHWRAARWGLLLCLALGGVVWTLVGPRPQGAGADASPEPSGVPPHPLTRPALALPATRIWSQDAPDPDVVRFGTEFYTYTTGAVWGFHIGVLKSSALQSGWHAAADLPQRSSALPHPPAWEALDTQNAPTVVKVGSTYVMFYDAGVASDPSLYCLSRATASSPAGPFTDDSAGHFGPCSSSYNGSVDPDVVSSGPHLYLVWKENDSGPYGSAQLISQELADGASKLVGPEHVLLTQHSSTFHWETTTENPALTHAGGAWWLLFSAGLWTNSTYSEAFVKCVGPTGPCGGDPTRILTSYGAVHGPGGAFAVEASNGEWHLAFAAWTSPCTGEGGSCGRELYMAPIEFSALAVKTASLGSHALSRRVREHLEASGGIGPERWSASGLPKGLRVHPETGVLAGRARSSGRSEVTVTVSTTGPHPEHASRQVELTLRR